MNSLFALWGQPMIDLFATQENKKAMLFCSWIPSQHAFALDALSVAWENMYAYTFPPIQLIHKSTLSHETVPVYCNTDSALLASSAVVSNSSQSADSKACQTSMQSGSSVSESGGGVTSRTRDVELDGMDVVDRHLSTKGFSSKTRQLLSASWRKGTKRDYN